MAETEELRGSRTLYAAEALGYAAVRGGEAPYAGHKVRNFAGIRSITSFQDCLGRRRGL